MNEFFDAPTVVGICQKIKKYQEGENEFNPQKIMAVSRETYRVNLNE